MGRAHIANTNICFFLFLFFIIYTFASMTMLSAIILCIRTINYNWHGAFSVILKTFWFPIRKRSPWCSDVQFHLISFFFQLWCQSKITKPSSWQNTLQYEHLYAMYLYSHASLKNTTLVILCHVSNYKLILLFQCMWRKFWNKNLVKWEKCKSVHHLY